jgi:alpha-tubulin suppressor-like RCC1 family protein
MCWGLNDFGQLGDGSLTDSWRDYPTEVVGITNATAISAGSRHACVVLADNTPRCWGYNMNGELGHGLSYPYWAVPVHPEGIYNATDISAGGNHSCALLITGSVKCWGLNNDGQLGNGATISLGQVLKPVTVIGITGAVAISAGFDHTCTLEPSGVVSCWGNNRSGALGAGANASYSTLPVQVSGVSAATAVTSQGQHSCVLLADATAKCWGDNRSGQLGDGSPPGRPDYSNTPVDVVGVAGLTELTSTCAAFVTREMSCWGPLVVGPEGNTTLTETATPQPVPNLP